MYTSSITYTHRNIHEVNSSILSMNTCMHSHHPKNRFEYIGANAVPIVVSFLCFPLVCVFSHHIGLFRRGLMTPWFMVVFFEPVQFFMHGQDTVIWGGGGWCFGPLIITFPDFTTDSSIAECFTEDVFHHAIHLDYLAICFVKSGFYGQPNNVKNKKNLKKNL